MRQRRGPRSTRPADATAAVSHPLASAVATDRPLRRRAFVAVNPFAVNFVTLNPVALARRLR